MTTPLPQRRCQLENQFSWSKTVFLHDFMTSPSMKSWSFWAKNEQIALPTRRSRRSRWAWAGPWQRTKWKTVDLKVISASPTKKSLDFESDLPEGLPSSLYTPFFHLMPWRRQSTTRTSCCHGTLRRYAAVHVLDSQHLQRISSQRPTIPGFYNFVADSWRWNVNTCGEEDLAARLWQLWVCRKKWYMKIEDKKDNSRAKVQGRHTISFHRTSSKSLEGFAKTCRVIELHNPPARGGEIRPSDLRGMQQLDMQADPVQKFISQTPKAAKLTPVTLLKPWCNPTFKHGNLPKHCHPWDTNSDSRGWFWGLLPPDNVCPSVDSGACPLDDFMFFAYICHHWFL